MRRLTSAGVLVVWTLLSGGRPQAAECEPIGKVQFICDIQAPEDFAIVTGSDWMLTSGNRPGQGAIRALHLRQKKIVTVFPAANAETAHDAKAFPGCPGPIDLTNDTEKKTFAIHGMYPPDRNLIEAAPARRAPRRAGIHRGVRR